MIIALDGPAGSGKSTIAKIIAKELNIDYLDTGAMYRMVTYHAIKNNIDLYNQDQLEDNLKNITIKIMDDKFYLNEEIVDQEIRSVEVTQNVSKVASNKKVREFLVEQQRETAKVTSCILDGRDIGTVVFPDTEYKFFLTASAEVRAQRRFDQNQGLDNEQSYEEILKDIIKRDELDSNRKESPLKKAKDAIEIDSSNLTIIEVSNLICQKIKE